jgi:hypothetical protein
VTPLTEAYPPDSAINIIGTTVQTVAGLPLLALLVGIIASLFPMGQPM